MSVSAIPERERPLHPNAHNLIGHRFGSLEVVSHQGWKITPSGCKIIVWRCACDCGATTDVMATSLRGGGTKSCGCLRKKLASINSAKHGLHGSPEYQTWGNMINRCHSKRNKSYPRYGGSGVTVCDEWRKNFKLFYDHVGPRPTPDHSIDRIDSSKGYCPGNVKWSTIVDQNRNRRNVHRVLHNGQMVTLKEYCDDTGISINTVLYRFRVLKWPLHEAISPKKGKRSR
jgi:hypothetical protein